MTKVEFKKLESVENIKEVVANLFDIELNIAGGWGYGSESALKVEQLDIPIEQFINMFTTLRSNVEMNFDKKEKYGGITLSLEELKSLDIDNTPYQIARFNLSAMSEKVSAEFIKEYKENYGKKEFDIGEHFKRRKEQTLTRVVECWFYMKE